MSKKKDKRKNEDIFYYENLKRDIKEKLAINSYLVVPFIYLLTRLTLSLILGINLSFQDFLNVDIVDASLAILFIAMTISSLLLTLPENDFTEALRKYNYCKILSSLTISIVVLSISNILLESHDLFSNIQSIQSYIFDISLINLSILSFLYLQIIIYMKKGEMKYAYKNK